MASQALIHWRRTRRDRLNRLFRLRAAVVGSDEEARLARQELGRAALVALITEFQGYCRDLHDEASDAFALAAAANPRSAQHIGHALRLRRQLDRGNATVAALKDDFARFGMALRASTERVDPRSSDRWQLLETLTGDRNALVHANSGRVAGTSADDPPIAHVRSSLAELGRLARTMDQVVASHLAGQFTIRRPW